MEERSEVFVFNCKNIEAILRHHPSVRECVVLDRADAAGVQSLVVYIVSNQAGPANTGELRSHIKKTLPDFRMPAKFVILNSLPFMPNGTVDRAALVGVDPPERISPQEHVAPRTPNEKLMANIWQETLKVENVGVFDNFFDIVRDSSLAMTIITRVRSTFAVHLPVRALFADPTVAGMTAAVLDQQTKWTNRRGLAESVTDLHTQRREQVRNYLSKN